MGFWIYMLIANLLLPAAMIGFGGYFARHAPKEINPLFGYRTAMSMKNRETWEFAHRYCGRLWRVIGWSMLAASVAVMLFVMGRDVGTVGAYGGILSMAQLAVLIASVLPTERALRRTFDENGCRRE